MGYSLSKRVTIADIAVQAGVAKSTVSYVLNPGTPGVTISEKTRRRVLEVIRQCGYVPNASAQALSTARTGQIGFILQDTIDGGWTNGYFASILQGVEGACHERGYGLNISRYNLTNLDTFVFPSRVAQRSIDGLILTGYVEAEVIRRFSEFNIPCVCIGDNVEVAKLIPTISADIVGGLFMAVRHGRQLGHGCIGYVATQARRSQEVVGELCDRVSRDTACSDVRVVVMQTDGVNADYHAGREIGEQLVRTDVRDRPTLMIGSAQSLSAMQGVLGEHDQRCPDDMSMICECDINECEFNLPRMTAIALGQERLGRIGTGMLIDHLELGRSLTPDMSRNDFPCELVVRDSCIRHAADGE